MVKTVCLILCEFYHNFKMHFKKETNIRKTSFYSQCFLSCGGSFLKEHSRPLFALSYNSPTRLNGEGICLVTQDKQKIALSSSFPFSICLKAKSSVIFTLGKYNTGPDKNRLSNTEIQD